MYALTRAPIGYFRNLPPPGGGGEAGLPPPLLSAKLLDRFPIRRRYSIAPGIKKSEYIAKFHVKPLMTSNVAFLTIRHCWLRQVA